MRRFLFNLVVLFGLVSLVAQPIEAARIFRAGQQTFLKGVDPKVATSGCTWPSANLLLDLDASDTAHILTTIAGSTPVSADGDPVGQWKDANGNGFNLAAAADDTTRPTWHSGTYPYVTFDGTNDILFRAAQLTMFSGGSATIVMSVRHVAGAQGTILAEGSSSANNPVYEMGRNLAADFNDLTAVVRDNGGVSNFVGTTLIYDEAFPVSTDVVVVITDSGTVLTGYKDSTSGQSAAGYTRGTTTLDRFAVGGRRRAASDNFAAFDLYRLRVYSGVHNSTDIAMDLTCGGLEQGRTL